MCNTKNIRKVNPGGKLMCVRERKGWVEIIRRVWGGWEAVEEREISGFWLLPKQMVGLTKRWWLARVWGEARLHAVAAQPPGSAHVMWALGSVQGLETC